MTYKMKGSPMQRNFGISPIKDVDPHTSGHTHKGDKASSSNWLQADIDYEKLRATKGSHEVKMSKLTERYGGKWKHRSFKDKAGNLVQGGYINQKGQTPKDAEEEYLDESKNVG